MMQHTSKLEMKRFFLSYEKFFPSEMAKVLPSADGKKNLERSEKLGFSHVRLSPFLRFDIHSGTFKQFLNGFTFKSYWL